MNAMIDLDIGSRGRRDALPDARRRTPIDLLYIAREALSNVVRHSRRDAAPGIAPRPSARRPGLWTTTAGASTPSQVAGPERRAAPGPAQHARPRDRAWGERSTIERADRCRHTYHRARTGVPGDDPEGCQCRHRRREEAERDRLEPRVPCACWSSTTTRSSGRGSSRSSIAAKGSRSSPRPATAAESIEQARRFQPDIVVMDVRLPDGSGIEACREIRAELADHAGRDAHLLSGRGGRPVGDRRRRARLPAQADPRPRPRRRARGRRSRRVAARPGRDREGPRAGAPDRHRRRTPTSSRSSPRRSSGSCSSSPRARPTRRSRPRSSCRTRR